MLTYNTTALLIDFLCKATVFKYYFKWSAQLKTQKKKKEVIKNHDVSLSP